MELFSNGSCKGLHCTSMHIFRMFEAIGQQKLTKKMAAKYAQFPCFPCLTSFCEKTVRRTHINFGILLFYNEMNICANLQVFWITLYSINFFRNMASPAKNMFIMNLKRGWLAAVWSEGFQFFFIGDCNVLHLTTMCIFIMFEPIGAQQ